MLENEQVIEQEQDVEDKGEPLEYENVEEEQGSNEEPEAGEVNDDDDKVDEPDNRQESESFKQMRQRLRELNKENRELKSKLAPPQDDNSLPNEPTLADFDYDEGEFKAAHKQWVKKSIEIEEKQKEIKRKQEEIELTFKEKVKQYEESKKSYDEDEVEDAEFFVRDNFSDVQQGIMVEALDNPIKFVLFLNKDKELAKSLAKSKSPISFASQIAKLEKEINVDSPQKVKKSFAVDKPLRSSVGALNATSQALDKLLEKARATGDYTEYHRQKAKLNK